MLEAGVRPRRKLAAAAVVTLLMALGTAACLPSASAGPSDPTLSSLLAAVNADRAANGLPALGWSQALADAATSWSGHMAASYNLDHQDLDSLGAATGCVSMGENVFMGPQGTPASTVESTWMGSTWHRFNILRGEYDFIGLGIAQSGNGEIWITADFCRK